ncbi:hypothetical protein [uncultured Desulfuromusa sp.]|uniref:hypothetical protein n=1 Tax=uncultured Desulfuromusa sp. TaxID=219183 RepID=UPI002AA884F5|nr:hypothetical protein [uncultured Desulfuromusa sp.]
MLRIFYLLLLLGLVSCVSATPPQQLPQDCRAEASVEQLLAENWLGQSGIWRLRQVTLLEIGSKKIPLEGFLRLDLVHGEARLVAMNEMGLVLFDLLVTEEGQQLQRAIPQLQQVKGLSLGIGQSLRQIFLQPRPQFDDKFEMRNNVQFLRREFSDGSLVFSYDCRKDLRNTRLSADGRDWRVAYDQYRQFGSSRIPEQIIMNDFQHGVKLSLWVREIRQE